jgi:hypothetical protein
MRPHAARPRRRLVRAATFVGVVMTVPAISAASLSTATLSSFAPTPSAVVPSANAKTSKNGCRDGMARVGSSCVDKYEASLLEIADDGAEVSFSPYEAPNGHHVRAVSRAGVVPQAHVSMVEAKRACEASGKRLCRAKEWKAACKGPESTRYPYGNARIPGACVDTNRTSPMGVLHNGEHSSRTMNDPRANQLEGTVEPTGSSAACANGYGVHDMVGNVHEWTDDASFRGGYYLDTSLNGEGCEYRTSAHAASYYDYSTGFRCCADADSEGGDVD